MDILTLDFETYYDKDYSLRKMTPVEYILDDRFECTLLTVKRGDQPTLIVEGDEVQEFFDAEPTNVLAVSHNSLFDMAICAWRYGWLPKLMVDTLGVARAVLQKELKSLSLASVAKHLGLQSKGGALAKVIGMSLAEIRSNHYLYESFKEYGVGDTDICYGIFKLLVMSGKFPVGEIAVMDMVLRCAIQPQFIGDAGLLNQSLVEIKQEKEISLANAMMVGAADKKDLMSNPKFADLLMAHGVVPPKKISPLTGRETFAFAKSDQEFLDLLEHPSVGVQALVAARLDHKSTIEETRHERFIAIANLDWPSTAVTTGGYRHLMPMPLKYSGAHTHRLSGDWQLNVQNMGRGSTLRKSLKAPEGHVVVAGDESQIEARLVATLSGQEDLRYSFEVGNDVYCEFATDLFGRPITKADKIERWLGKTSILGLGYGLGWEKFGGSIPTLSFNQMGVSIPMPDQEAQRVVSTYRTKYSRISATWKLLNERGIRALTGTDPEWWFGPVLFRKEEILLPNGLSLYYHNLRQEPGGRFGFEWVFDYAGKKKRCYGGMLLENICQALGRIIVMDAAVRIQKRLAKLGIRLALQVHDELVYVVKHEHEKILTMVLEHELRARPSWLPNLPLDCEVASGINYGEAK